MRYSLPYKTKHFFFVLIKISIVIGAGYFIYQKLTDNPEINFQQFVQFTTKSRVLSPKNIVLLLILTGFNWFFESLKWQKMVSVVENINLKNAIAQSLGSLTASLFTPNRIGEYGAKAMHFKPHFRKKVMLVNLLSNMLQMSITLILGIIGISVFISIYEVTVDYYKIARIFLIALTVLFLIIFGVKHNRFKIKGFSLERIKTYVLGFPRYHLILGFLFSFIRYVIFSFQFYLILQLFGVNLAYFQAMSAITSMYILASIIPSIVMFDVVIKGSVAVYLFSFLEINELIILSTITLMWLLNFVIPSIFGSYYVATFKLPNGK